MTNRPISYTQLTALVWAGILSPVAELLPALTLPVAGKGAWLAPLAAIPLVLLDGWVLDRLSGREGFPAAVQTALGPLGRPVLLIYIMWGELLLALRLRLCAQRLAATGYRDGTLWFFLLAVAGMVLWMGFGQLDVFARAGQLFLVFLLIAGGGVLLLSLGQTKPEHTLPLWTEDLLPVLKAALSTAGVLGWGLFGACLTGKVCPEEKRRWHWFAWGAGGCLLLTLAQWITLANLGPELAARLDNPFFALAKAMGVEGAFQRAESLISALWVLADLVLAGLLLFSLETLYHIVWPGISKGKETVGTVILAILLAGTLFAEGMGEVWNRMIVPCGNLILGLALPALMLFVRWVWRKHLYFVGDGDETSRYGGKKGNEKKVKKR